MDGHLTSQEIIVKVEVKVGRLLDMAMSTQVEQLIKEVQQLSIDELRLLCKAVLKQLAVPLHEPAKVYDDWDDPEVDAIYADTW